MCGIVGAIAQRDVGPILLEGLARLEYRGYDSAGLALLMESGLERARVAGRVAELRERVTAESLHGKIGIAHTRWATHGQPTENNAHPHVSGDEIVVVHNGIIENHQSLREALQASGYHFSTDTDTEVIAHLIHSMLPEHDDMLSAMAAALQQLEGAYALGVMHASDRNAIYFARKGSPLVLGVGDGENYLASDPLALLQVTDRYVYLNENEYGMITLDEIKIFNANAEPVPVTVKRYEHADVAVERGSHRHYMHKEIYEQPAAIENTLAGKLGEGSVLTEALGFEAESLIGKVRQIHIVACGTSYHAGMVARYWFEEMANIPCSVEIASEYRYRHVLVQPETLFVAISQSGETADTLAALNFAKQAGYLGTLALCNAAGSSLVRESGMHLMTMAGPEIGVASTKAFTTQLTALYWLCLVLAKHNAPNIEQEEQGVMGLRQLAGQVEEILKLEDEIADLAKYFSDKEHALFLGRGIQYPVALEGALKLKEISYIHAEAYAAGELKHGPLALVDEEMPVVAVAPNDLLLQKLLSNLEEVKARGGRLIVFADESISCNEDEYTYYLKMPHVNAHLSPIVYSVPLQLLAYHAALIKGTDVDKPRNLAKSVTVE